jgi:hypothetical protein
MNKINETIVMITRAEYDELVKSRLIVAEAISNIATHEDETLQAYTCISTDLLKMLFPDNVAKKLGDGQNDV